VVVVQLDVGLRSRERVDVVGNRHRIIVVQVARRTRRCYPAPHFDHQRELTA
jgi:hypothetical protein